MSEPTNVDVAALRKRINDVIVGDHFEVWEVIAMLDEIERLREKETALLTANNELSQQFIAYQARIDALEDELGAYKASYD